jgi:hypothetical protein
VTESLYTSQTPIVTNASDGTPGITTATTLNFLVDGFITHVRFYATSTVGGTYTAAVYEVTAADPPGIPPSPLATKIMAGSPTGGTWNTIALDTPVAVQVGKYYRVAIHNNQGRYVASNNFFLTVVTNGNVVGESTAANPFGAFSQGAFVINAALTYPSSEGSATSYFVDVLFELPGGTTPVSQSVDLRWKVSGSVASSIDFRWASAGSVSRAISFRWAVISDAVPYVPPPVLVPRLRKAELKLQRKNTDAFIKADPYVITLVRRVRFQNAAGGITKGDTRILPAQVFRLLPQEDGATERVNAEGERATPEYMLLGRYDVDMQRFDVFEYDGRRYQVVWISENRQYEIKGEVVHLGE